MALAYLFLVLAVVGGLAGVLARRRVQETVKGDRMVVSDETLSQILQDGSAEFEEEEPLDEQAIREAEERFWDESWDEPEAEDWR